jgi:hypothetical protein
LATEYSGIGKSGDSLLILEKNVPKVRFGIDDDDDVAEDHIELDSAPADKGNTIRQYTLNTTSLEIDPT